MSIDRDDINMLLKVIGTAVIVVIGLIVAISIFFIPFSIADCNALTKQTGHPTQWVFWGGGDYNCLIKLNDQWIPTSNWIYKTQN